MSIKGDKRVEEYLSNVCRLIKNKRVHKNIKDELISHIEEIVEDYTSINYTEEQAIEKALEQLGSYEMVGNELNNVHKATPDWILIAMTGIFILMGMFVLGYIDRSYSGELMPYSFLARTIIYSGIGIAVAYVISKIDYRVISKYSKIIYIGSIVLMITSFSSINYINGVQGYIVLGPIAFNVFSVSSFFLIIALAGIFNKYNWGNVKELWLGLLLIFAPCVLFILGASLASLSIYFIGALAIALISGLKLRYFFGAIGTIFTIGIIYLFTQPYRSARLFVFLTPYRDIEGAGWIYNRLSQLRNAGGFFGAEKAFSPDMLPDFYTDFMLTFIMYSFGWVVTLILIALVLVFIFRMGSIGMKTRESYGKLLVWGLCAYFSAQFLFNILMNLTLSPTIAVGMPFISYGGSGLIINILTIGIITSVCKCRNTPSQYDEVLN